MGKDWGKILLQNIKLECVRGLGVSPIEQKTKVILRLQKGLCSSESKSACNLDIPFKSKNNPLIRDTINSKKASK